MRKRKWKPPRALPKGVKFMALPGGSQELAYERMMGRPWNDPDPWREDFGGPIYPAYATWGTPEGHAAFAEYDIAYKAWEASPRGLDYERAWDRWKTRREQFDYTGRKRGDRERLQSWILQDELPVAA